MSAVLEGGGAADASVFAADGDAAAQAAAIRAVFPLLAYLPGGRRHRYVLDRALRLLRRPPALRRAAGACGASAGSTMGERSRAMLTSDGRSGDSTPTFLGWAGDPRQATDPKIANREIATALERFAARFGQPATVVRMPITSPITEYPGIQVERVRTVPPGQVWPGAVLLGPGPGTDAATAPEDQEDRAPEPAGLAAGRDSDLGRERA